jgi:FkbH-like protein
MNTEPENRIAEFRSLFQLDHALQLDSDGLLLHAARFAKVENEYAATYAGELSCQRIAVLASFTIYHTVRVMKLFLYRVGIAPTFYEGEYDSIASELLDKESGLFTFAPDVLLVLPYHTDLRGFPALFAAPEEVDAWVADRAAYYEQLWAAAASIPGCQVIQSLFVAPVERQLGNLESNYYFSRTTCLRLLNIELNRRRASHVLLLDTDYIAANFGKSAWFDPVAYFTSKQGFTLDAVGVFAHSVARVIAAHVGKMKKCLVLDLDNTLWGGVIGDDGLQGIDLNQHSAIGEAFLAFQRYIRQLKDRGVILAVCSKNEELIAKSPFLEHSGMLIRLDDIACFVANWDDKATNIRRIALQLNIGLDSMVFFDDNPAERALVRQFLPEVEVVEVPQDPAYYAVALESSCAFEWMQLSREDLFRSTTYVSDNQRAQLQQRFVNYDDYLMSLEMEAVVAEVGDMEQDRVVQLIAKSNQFNLRTKRHSDADIKEFRGRREDSRVIYIALTDKFGAYGIILASVLRRSGAILFIDTLVMSCRVLKRGVEYVLFNAVLDVARQWGCEWLVGEFIPTKKNAMVSTLFLSLGFEPCSRDTYPYGDDAGLLFRARVSSVESKMHFIKLR